MSQLIGLSVIQKWNFTNKFVRWGYGVHAHHSTDEQSEFLQMWRNPVKGHILLVNESVSHQVSQLL